MAAKKKAASTAEPKKKSAKSVKPNPMSVLTQHLLAFEEPKKIPPAIAMKDLPRLAHKEGDVTFDDAEMLGLARALIAGKLGDDPLRLIVRDKTTLDSRDALALALLRFWEAKEFHGRYDWVFDGVFALGGDQAIIALAGYMATWPAQSDSGRKRTIRSVPALVDTGTDTALLALCGLRQTAVVPSVLEAIIDGLNRAVEARDTTLSELLDAITPTLGLDEHGKRAFDYGSRRFMVMFDDHFEPRLRDENNVITNDLPPLESSDDLHRASHAQAEWASLSAQLREAVKIQSFRLEQDMVNGRRWDAKTWSRCFKNHPLLVSFTRRIVWGLYEPKTDALIGSFRTAEDHSLVGIDDTELTIADDARIGVIHPLQLSEAARAQWGTHLADYEIIQPFGQLGRTLNVMTENEKSDGATTTTRYASSRFKSGLLRDILVKKGWDRDPSYHREFYQRNFGHDGVVAIATMSPGVAAGSASYDVADQTIPTIEFRKKKGRGKSREPIALSEVPPVAFSEAVLDLADVLVEQDHL